MEKSCLEENQMRRFGWASGLWLVIACGVFFRGYDLLERGPIRGDGITNWKAVIDAVQNQIYIWYHAKPGHIFLLWLFSIPFGLKPFVPVLVSLLSGLSTIVLIYYLGSKFYSQSSGLAAAAILAVSPWHIEYSRTTLSVANAIFFWTLSLVLYLKSRPDGFREPEPALFLRESQNPTNHWIAIGAGLILGFAFTCHYNLGLMPFVFLIFEIHLGLKIYFQIKRLKQVRPLSQNENALYFDLFSPKKNKSCFLFYATRVFSLFMAMLIPLILFNTIHIYLHYMGEEGIAKASGNNTALPFIFTYGQQIFIQLVTSTTEIWGTPSDFNFWRKTIWNNEGSIASILFLIGFGWCLVGLFKQCNIQKLAITLPLVISFAFLFNSKYTGASRSLALSLPLMALLSAFVLSKIGKEKWQLLLFFFPFSIFVQNLPLLVSQIQINSVGQQLRNYIQKKNIPSIIAQGQEVRFISGLPADKTILSPSLEWTQKEVQKARALGLEIQPQYLLAQGKPKELHANFRCQPLAAWVPERGRSEIGFERGEITRNWDLTPQEELNRTIGIFLINDCFTK